jgi:hypothetical protein
MSTHDVDAIGQLREDALFAGLSGTQIARLAGTLHPMTFAAGETLYSQDTAAEFLYVITSGVVALILPSTRRVAVNDRCGLEVLAELPLYLSSAEATTEVTAIRIPKVALTEQAGGLKTKAQLALMTQISGETLTLQPAKKKAPAKVSQKDIIGWLAVIIAPPCIYAMGHVAGFSMEAALFMGVLSATVLMWLFSLVDEFVPPLVAIAAVLIIGLVPASVAMAGFSSNTLMILVCVYALAAVISSSGLSYRFMLWLLIRLPDTPFWHQAALLLSGYILSPIMPSGNARLSLVLPFYRDMFEGLDLTKHSKSATALMAATFSGAMLFSPMLLTSKSSNLTVFSMLPTQYQDEFQGLFWFVAAGVAALTVTLMHLVFSRLCFGQSAKAALPKDRLGAQLKLLGPISRAEKAALLGFLFFLIGAGTTNWHHINPAWLAAFLLAALLLMGLISKKDFQQKIDWPMIFFLLSLDGLSRTISYLRLDTALAHAAGDVFSFVNGDVGLFIPVALIVTLLIRLALPITAGMIVSTVILLPIAQAQMINPWVVVFLTAMFSDIWFMPYQSSQYLQVVSSGYGRYYLHSDFMRYNQLMNAARLVAAYLSIPYWHWLGLL